MLDMILGGGLNPISATIGTLVLLCAGVLWVAFSVAKFKQGPVETTQKGFLENSKRLQMIQNVTRIYESFNLKTIQSTTTEMMFYMCECTCKILQRVGVKKLVQVELDPQKEAGNTCQLIVEDGKNDGTLDIVHCRYSEIYKNSATGEVLYQRSCPNAHIVFSAIKSNQADLKAPKFCTQCGAPMEVQGDFFHCSYCGTHYQTDAFLWTVSGMQVVNTKKQEAQGAVMMWSVMGLLALSIIAMFAQNTKLNLVVYGLDLCMLAGVGAYIWQVNQKLQGLRACKAYDPLFSRDTFQRRVEYLYQLYHLAKDLDVSKIEPFMDAECYQAFLAGHTYDAFYHLDHGFLKLEMPAFKVENTKQWATCVLTVEEMTVNEKRKLRKKKKKVRLVLVRDEHCKTARHAMADQLICENCHAGINLAVDGKCKYCGTKIEMIKHDWCIHSVQE